MSYFLAYLIISLLIIFSYLKNLNACTSFYCINSCGSASSDGSNSGYKLILANNRDEDIYRATWPANVWPPKYPTKYHRTSIRNDKNQINCDQSKSNPPFNLCVYGALDVKNEAPPDYYSTWLGINERGSVGNLLFFMGPSSYQRNITKARGAIVGDYLQNSSWLKVEDFMQELNDEKFDYNPFNYIQLEMSKETGKYSLYYVNNNSTNTYKKMNPNEDDTFVFGISNSDPERPFQKVVKGTDQFKNILKIYGSNLNKQILVDSLVDLLQDTTPNMPDPTLAAFMRFTDPADEAIVRGVSQINANYSKYWLNGHSRTSTVILVDHNNMVEYYEYNMTIWANSSLDDLKYEWKMNSFSFQLNPLYLQNSSPIIKAFNGHLALVFVFSFIFQKFSLF